jgi:Dyp-type peroxidase family
MTSNGAPAAAPFDVDEVQGDILPGFKRPCRLFLVMKIDEPGAARRALGELANRVTKCSDIQKFRDEGQQAEVKAGPWLNVALSREGLERLGIAEFGTEEDRRAFRNGIEAATGPIEGRLPADESHILLSIAADVPAALSDEQDELVELLGPQGMTVTEQYDGSVIIIGGHAREHFGFRDGISQPAVEGFTVPQQGGVRRGTEIVPADRFVIGAGADRPEVGPDHHGSYMVFAKIEQLVEQFEEFCDESALRIKVDLGLDDVTREAAAALMIGRYKDGTPVDLGTFPEKPDVVAGDIDSFTYDDDPYGRVRPLGAHIRKMNARTNPVGDAHRILRRGVPYESDGEKGLLFVCYQASLADGFQYVHQRWANAPISSGETRLKRPLDDLGRNESLNAVNYPSVARRARVLPIDAPPDPLVGLPGREGGADFEVPRPNGRGGSTGLPLFNNWVRYRTGQYLFAPSISTLRQWAVG